MGVKEDRLKTEGWYKGDFFVGITIRNKIDNFRWNLYVVYGPAQHEHSKLFLNELKRLGEQETLPYIVGGDFNLIRKLEDRSSGMGDIRLIDVFNDYVEQAELRELQRGGAGST